MLEATLEVTLLATDDELLTLDAELATELATEFDELFTEELLTAELATEELVEVAVEQTLPVMVGFSATPPFLSPCTPKLTD